MGQPDFLPSAPATEVVARLVTADDRLIRKLPNVWFSESEALAAVAIPAIVVLDAKEKNGGIPRLELGRARVTIALPRGELILRWQAVERTTERTKLPGAGGKDAYVFRLSEVLRQRLCSFELMRPGR
jgi:hypothetical protein